VGAPLALSVTGSGFDVDSVIQVAGTALTTTYVSAAQLQATIPASSLTAAGTLAITVFNPALGGATSNSLGLSVVAQPVFTAAGVVNGASFQPGAAPGSIVSIFGSNLAGSTAAAFAIPLSKTLGGAAVSLNTTLLPLFYVSPGQINAQIPYTAAGSASLLVQYPGGSASQTITVVPVSPGIFTTNGAQGVIVNANGTLADASNPAPAGSIVVIYCTGLGAVTPPVVEGTAAPLNPPATTIATPQVLVGTTPSQEQAVLSFSGLSGGSVGLYQVNFQVPSDVSTGSIQIAISMGGVTSNVVTMAVMTQAK
jgi:uncharacterized protein (TIGR03437 family)